MIRQRNSLCSIIYKQRWFSYATPHNITSKMSNELAYANTLANDRLSLIVESVDQYSARH